MKKTIVVGIAALAMVAGSTYGQGTVSFANASTSKITRQDTGANVANSPAGGWKAQLYWLPGDVVNPGTEAFTVKAGNMANIGVPVAGQFSGGTITIPTTTAGAEVWIQVKAWEYAFGTTYEAAVANRTPQNGRLALAGTSNIFKVDTSDPTAVPTPLPASLAAMQGFVLVPVPEPGAVALGLLGLGALLALRRRK